MTIANALVKYRRVLLATTVVSAIGLPQIVSAFDGSANGRIIVAQQEDPKKRKEAPPPAKAPPAPPKQVQPQPQPKQAPPPPRQVQPQPQPKMQPPPQQPPQQKQVQPPPRQLPPPQQKQVQPPPQQLPPPQQKQVQPPAKQLPPPDLRQVQPPKAPPAQQQVQPPGKQLPPPTQQQTQPPGKQLPSPTQQQTQPPGKQLPPPTQQQTQPQPRQLPTPDPKQVQPQPKQLPPTQQQTQPEPRQLPTQDPKQVQPQPKQLPTPPQQQTQPEPRQVPTQDPKVVQPQPKQLPPQPPVQPQTFGQPKAPPPDARIGNVNEVKGKRREERQGNTVVIREPGNRTIIRENNTVIIRHDESERMRRWGNAKFETRGNERYTIVNRGGYDVVTITDPHGRMLRRYRRFPDGREYGLIDNRRRWGAGAVIAGGAVVGGAVLLGLAMPRITIPRERYIVEMESAPPAYLYEALDAPPLVAMERPYTLDEVRDNYELRARVRSVDINTINFSTGSWEISPEQVARLQSLAQAMSKVISENPSTVFLLEGHTDAVGAAEDNLSLSDRRAEAVAEALTTHFNIPPENLVTQGYGEQHLRVQTDGPSRENRRVEVRNVTGLMAAGQGQQGEQDGPPSGPPGQPPG